MYIDTHLYSNTYCGCWKENSAKRSGTTKRCGFVAVGVTVLEQGCHCVGRL